MSKKQDTLGYKGTVKISAKNKKTKSIKNLKAHNTGTKQLGFILANFLANNYTNTTTSNVVPAKAVLIVQTQGQGNRAVASAVVTSTELIANPTDSDSTFLYGVKYTFTFTSIMKNTVEGNFYMGLQDSRGNELAKLAEDDVLSAVADTLSSGQYDIIIDWQLSFHSVTEVKEDE